MVNLFQDKTWTHPATSKWTLNSKSLLGGPHIAAHLQAHKPIAQSQPAKELQFCQRTGKQSSFSTERFEFSIALQTELMRTLNMTT